MRTFISSKETYTHFMDIPLEPDLYHKHDFTDDEHTHEYKLDTTIDFKPAFTKNVAMAYIEEYVQYQKDHNEKMHKMLVGLDVPLVQKERMFRPVARLLTKQVKITLFKWSTVLDFIGKLFTGKLFESVVQTRYDIVLQFKEETNEVQIS